METLIAIAIKKAVFFIINKIGDRACPTWKSVGFDVGDFRVAVKREGGEWYIGFHRGSGGGRYRSDGWVITRLVKKMSHGMVDQADAEAITMADNIFHAIF